MPLVLEPSWVGRRVSVRRVLAQAPDGRLTFGDVVGDLVELVGPAGRDAQTAVVETRDGLVEVPVALVAAARLAPPSTADELALEAVAARGLRPAETQQLGGWQLRADHGFTRRANSVAPLRQLGMPLDEALGLAHDWYAARGLPLRMHLPVEARRLLDADLGERGWAAEPLVHVFAGRLGSLHAPEGDAAPVEFAGSPDDAWLALYRGGSGLEDTARALLTRHDRVCFASLRIDGRTAAVVRGAVDDEWLGVMALEVDPGYRRRGLAAALMRALWAWGAAHGARRSYLQVWADNAPAVTLYEKLGYWVHHDYHCRTEPEARSRLGPAGAA
jgi:ribosomal protein S18 acetylase RimI-like enzyme